MEPPPKKALAMQGGHISALKALGRPVQIAYAVPDAAAAAQQWATVFGAGPFVIRSNIELVDVVHRGVPATFDHTSACGQWGSLMVELVEDHTAGRSVINDQYPDGGSGLHHIAFFVDDLVYAVRELIKHGLEVAMSARSTGGTAFHFVDARGTHGHFLELYEPSERLQRFYSSIAAAANGWDGSDPVRAAQQVGTKCREVDAFSFWRGDRPFVCLGPQDTGTCHFRSRP
jgi:predicted enzyme related to lactoylglutathione lyase